MLEIHEISEGLEEGGGGFPAVQVTPITRPIQGVSVFDHVNTSGFHQGKIEGERPENVVGGMRAVVNNEVVVFRFFLDSRPDRILVGIPDHHRNPVVGIFKAGATRVNVAADEAFGVDEELGPDLERSTVLDADFEQADSVVLTRAEKPVVDGQVGVPFVADLAGLFLPVKSFDCTHGQRVLGSKANVNAVVAAASQLLHYGPVFECPCQVAAGDTGTMRTHTRPCPARPTSPASVGVPPSYGDFDVEVHGRAEKLGRASRGGSVNNGRGASKPAAPLQPMRSYQPD